MRVLNFGSLNIDYVYQVDHFVQPGETMSAASLRINCGGKGLNQSVALARAGVETWHAGCIGAEGLFLKEKLAAAGVNTTFVRQVEGSTGHAIIQVDRKGQNCILLHDGANGRITEAFAEEVLSAFGPEDVLLLQNETSCVGHLLARAAEKGMRVALNAAPANERLKDLPLERLRWLLVNEVEGAFLAGTEDPEEMARVLTRRYPQTMLVLTLGIRGSLAALGEERVRMPARRVTAVDTTAAGDTFTGFFIAGIAAGEDVSTALEEATKAAAIAISRKGAAPSIPSRAETLTYGG